MPVNATYELTIPSRKIPEGRLYTARSHLLDRIVPDCEVVALPEKELAGGRVSANLGPVTYGSGPVSRRGKLMRKVFGSQPASGPRERVLIDLRANSPENWAHFLNNHLPFLFAVLDGLDVEWERALALVPSDSPKFIHAAAELFGVELWATDDAVTGHGINFTAEPWQSVRAMRREWALMPRVQQAVEQFCSRGSALPARVFLSRKDTRVISNLAEVMAVLTPLGFETVYPEELSPADQFRLLRDPEALVAVHGAGLAPLLYRAEGPPPCKFVEILPCGHMTDVYRVMSDQVDASWVGVRGRIKPEYVEAAYNFDKPFTAYSLDNFEVDPVSLQQACDAVGLTRSPARRRPL